MNLRRYSDIQNIIAKDTDNDKIQIVEIEEDEIREKGWSLDNPAYLAAGQVVSAATNIPLDRGIRKLQNLKDASDAENEEWMRVANALGWAKWELEWAQGENATFKGKRKIRRASENNCNCQ